LRQAIEKEWRNICRLIGDAGANVVLAIKGVKEYRKEEDI
jgi:hypothetical protein